MIRSSKLSLKFVNAGKMELLRSFIEEYTRVVNSYIGLIWEMEKVPGLLPKDITSKVETGLSARVKQAAGKQASGIVRGTRKKQEKRLFVIERLKKEDKLEAALKLQSIYDSVKISKPVVNQVNPELDSRFFKIEVNEDNKEFDIWITLSNIGMFKKIYIPLKKTKHFNELLGIGKIKGSIRLSLDMVTFCFEVENKEINNSSKVLGVDIGKNKVISCSNGFKSVPDRDGYDLNKIINKMSVKKVGSKSYNRCKEQRKNYINWTINRLDLTGIKEVRIEDIKDLKRGKKRLGKLLSWVYADIFRKIGFYCERWNVSIVKVNPAYTSRRCSVCGWVQEKNRDGEVFRCLHCNHTMDADENAAINISLDLVPLGKRSSDKFFWRLIGQEFIVPVNPETYGVV